MPLPAAEHNRRYRAYKTQWARINRAGQCRANVHQRTIPERCDTGMELEDIARIIGMTHQGVTVAIRRAVRKLWRKGVRHETSGVRRDIHGRWMGEG